MDSAPEAFVTIDEASHIVAWNAQAEHYFGWRREEVMGRSLVDTIIPATSRAAHRAGIARFLETGEGPLLGRRAELTAMHRDGHLLPIELSLWATSHPGRWTFSALIRPIAAGAASRRQVDSVLESSSDAVMTVGVDGRILRWSGGAQQLFGHEPATATGRAMVDLVRPDRADEAARVLERARHGQAVARHETVLLTNDGGDVEVALTLSPVLDDAGAVTAVLVAAHDLSEQRWMAAALDTTLVALQQAVEESTASKDRARVFLADAAHQLRTPVAGIQACSQALMSGTGPEDHDALLADIVRESARASRLVASLLTMARLDEGEALVRVPCDLVALCTDEADRAWVLAPHLDMVMRVEGLPDAKPELDPTAVREILANLLDNSRRHARDRIEIAVGMAHEDTIEVRVHDDGPGVAPEMCEQIFGRFVSLDGRGGSGLGLAIGRDLARAHGGDLGYVDKAFVLTLPFSEDEAQP